MSGYFCIQWHITNRCDQRCKHCYIFNTGAKVNTRDWDIQDSVLMLDSFEQFCQKCNKRPCLSITGGDPILHPNFWQIVKEVAKRRIPFSILGNPFYIDAKKARRLVELGCWGYQMSLDGMRETHDFFRKPGSFDLTVQKFRELADCGMYTIQMATVSKRNYLEIPEVTRLVVDLGVNVSTFARYCPTHDDIESNIAPREYRAFLSTMWGEYTKLAKFGTKFNLKDHLWKLFLYENGFMTLEENTENIIFDGCHCGISHLTLLEDGTAFACRRMHSPIGHIQNKSIEDLFFSEALDSYRQIDNIQKCQTCELLCYCRGCRAVAACSNSGDFYAPDPQCWR